MQHRYPNAGAGRSGNTGAASGLLIVLAIVATFFLSPLLYRLTILKVQAYTVSNYGYGFEDFVALAWGCVCAALVFFVSRAVFWTAVRMGSLALATRFF